MSTRMRLYCFLSPISLVSLWYFLTPTANTIDLLFGATTMPQTSIKIALIVCSTRIPRVGPDVSSWVVSTINQVISPNTTLTTLDLADFPLPISPRGATIPAHQPLPLPVDAYGDPAVSSWSKEVDKYAGFIFLTPQYNWSFPAAVKVAVDHLYHEWSKKPALIVSYGKLGGFKGNAQLRQVLLGVRMSPWEGKVLLPIVAGNGVELSDKGILDDEVVKVWNTGNEHRELQAQWKDLVEQASLRGKI
jgi:NAD(P)H-dependent FMN reductase